MGTDFMFVFDIISIVAGLFCIIAPDKAYNIGRKEKHEPSAKWPIYSRIIGVVFIALGLFFLWIEFSK